MAPRLFFLPVAISLASFPSPAASEGAAAGLVPRFDLPRSPAEIAQPARKGRFFEAVGRKAGLFGSEGEGFEAWVFPLKLLHDFRIGVAVAGSDERVDLGSRVERAVVRPESVTLTSTHSLFTIRQVYFTPLERPGSVLLLDIETSKPLNLTVSFVPDLRPMWPAGLGGQYASWNGQRRTFVISESRRKYNGLVGSPAATRGSSTPAHELAQGSVHFEIPVDPEQARRFYYPIVISGGQSGRDAAYEDYGALLASIPAEYSGLAAHARGLRERLVSVETPDPELDLAFEWAKIALDRGFVSNPDLGDGLVAGWGPSGESARPGFGWFFGGDTFLNEAAFSSIGDFETIRSAIRFLQKRQREDGKMMHELTQAAAWVRWFEEYPYGYYHADTTPFYIVALHDLLRQSGDRALLAESWESLRKAYRYCRSADEDGDGLIDNTRAGLGASELGSLLEGLKTDILLGALSPAAWRATAAMADLMGDSETAQDARRLRDAALRSANRKFWNAGLDTLVHALTVSGAQNRERTVWPSVGIVLGVFDPDRADPTLEMIGSSAVSTDWGARMLANTSGAYDPAAYNNGAVWPFLTGLASTAAYSRHYAHTGFRLLTANAGLTRLSAAGLLPELMSGDFFRTVETAVPHQLFSSGAVAAPLLRGLFGLEGDAFGREVRMTPHLPPSWEHARVLRYRVGEERMDLLCTRLRGTFRLRVRGGAGYTLRLSLPIGLLGVAGSARVDGKSVAAGERLRTVATPRDVHCEVEAALTGDTTIEIDHSGGVELELPSPAPGPGDSSRHPRVVSTGVEGGAVRVDLEGRAGTTASLRLWTDRTVNGVSGGRLEGRHIAVRFPEGPAGTFVRHRVTIR